MSSITESTPTNIVKSDRTGRTRYTKQYKQEVLAAFECKPPRVRRLKGLDLLGRGGEDGRFQAACGRSDLIAGWAARFAAAQVAGRRVSSLLGRVTGRCSMRCLR